LLVAAFYNGVTRPRIRGQNEWRPTVFSTNTESCAVEPAAVAAAPSHVSAAL
jgi:hypothetical protein